MKINKKQHITKKGTIKRNPNKLPYKKTIRYQGETYNLMLVVNNEVYYSNSYEEDVLLFNREMKLISDNSFAEDEFQVAAIYALKTGDYIFMSKETAYGAKQLFAESPKEWGRALTEYKQANKR